MSVNDKNEVERIRPHIQSMEQIDKEDGNEFIYNDKGVLYRNEITYDQRVFAAKTNSNVCYLFI